MPTYLCHGFRWHRPSIRIFVIVQDLDDASPDWIIRPATTRSLLDAFGRLYEFLPSHDLETDAEAEAAALVAAAAAAQKAADATAAAAAAGTGTEQRGRRQSFSQAARAKSKSRRDKKERDRAAKEKEKEKEKEKNDGGAPVPTAPSGPTPAAGIVRRNDGRDEVLARQDSSPVKLLEEYDTQRLDEVSRPHAYVADYVARIDLSASIVDEMARYERLQQQRWRREHKTKDGFPSMAGPSDEGSSLGAALGVGEGSGGATLTKRKKDSGWLEQLRDQLQRGEEIRWYIVVNDDEDRAYPGEIEGEETDDDEEEYGEIGMAATTTEPVRQERLAAVDPDDDILPGRNQRQSRTLDNFMAHGFADVDIATASSPPVSSRDLEREREREKERQRQRLRFELTGDPNILAKWDIPSPTTPTSGGGGSYRPGPGKPTITPSSSAASANTASGAPMVFSLPSRPATSSPQQNHQQQQQQNAKRERSSTVTSSLNSNNIGDEFAFPQPPPMMPTSRRQQPPPPLQQQSLHPQQRQQQLQQLQPPQPPSSPPPLPPLSPPTLRPQKSGDVSGLRPKTPNGRSSGGASGFRRLFGRSSKTAVNEATKP